MKPSTYKKTILTVTLYIILVNLPVLRSDELAIFEPYRVSGEKDGVPFVGHCSIQPDATYRLERTINDEVFVEKGIAKIDESQLLLSPEQNTGNAFTSVSRRYAIGYADDQVTWVTSDFADFQETLIQSETEEESTLQLFARVLASPGLCNYLFNQNIGVLDAEEGNEIYRSNQPDPGEIANYKKNYGIKTVLSLNGDQDKTFRVGIRTRKSAGRVQARFPGPRINLQKRIQELGLNHVTLSMGSTRAPTDAQLAKAFRVLTDDSMKPILMHCNAGADRTGIMGAIYRLEFMGWEKAEAKEEMRSYMWSAFGGTEIQGAYLDLYQRGDLLKLLSPVISPTVR